MPETFLKQKNKKGLNITAGCATISHGNPDSHTNNVPVAQLDRASDSDSEGRWFESSRAYQAGPGADSRSGLFNFPRNRAAGRGRIPYTVRPVRAMPGQGASQQGPLRSGAFCFLQAKAPYARVPVLLSGKIHALPAPLKDRRAHGNLSCRPPFAGAGPGK